MRLPHARWAPFAALVLPLLVIGTAPAGEPVPVFRAGEGGYHTFRIPSALVLPSGRLLAFAEGRRGGASDAGDIDLVVRSSDDRGATWSPPRVVLDDGPNTVGNPCPVVVRETGEVLLPFTRNLGEDTESEILAGTARGTRTVGILRSNDDGLTWSSPRDITLQAKDPDWTWYATGPGVSTQLASGRLVVPCDHAVQGTKAMGSHLLLSDDQGASWRIGGIVAPDTNECQVVETAPNRLLLNMRNHPRRKPAPVGRSVSVSEDAGQTFSPARFDPALPEPGCQAGLIRLPGRDARLLFTNPASLTRREAMTARLSLDGGATWPRSVLLTAGPAAYSCPAAWPDGSIGCLYETGVKNPYEAIVWQSIDIKASPTTAP
jgi:sialidase-1